MTTKTAPQFDTTTVAGFIKTLLVKNGKKITNEEALKRAAKKFDMTNKNHYPGWYRAQLTRQGVKGLY